MRLTAEKKLGKEPKRAGRRVWRRLPIVDRRLETGGHCRGGGCWDRAEAHGLADAGYKPHVVRVLASQCGDPSTINQHETARHSTIPTSDRPGPSLDDFAFFCLTPKNLIFHERFTV